MSKAVDEKLIKIKKIVDKGLKKNYTFNGYIIFKTRFFQK